MKIIRTVLGDIPASEIGKTDSHDHLIRSGGPEVVRNPMFLMDDTAAESGSSAHFSHPVGRPWFVWTLSAAAEMSEKWQR